MIADVINLRTRPDRWALQRGQARLHRIELRRLEASDGQEGRARFPTSPLSDGNLGLLCSVDRVLASVSDETGFVLLLEDDALLSPRFKARVTSLMATLPGHIWAVQLGFLGDSSWRPNNSVVTNLRKLVRPRGRLRALRRSGDDGLTAHEAELRRIGLTSTGIRGGTHALLLRSAAAPELRQRLIIGDLPLDNALATAVWADPRHFARAQRSLAWQAPLRSDIPWQREWATSPGAPWGTSQP